MVSAAGVTGARASLDLNIPPQSTIGFLQVAVAESPLRSSATPRVETGGPDIALRLPVTDLCSPYCEIWDASSLTRERNSFKRGEGLALR